MQKFFIAFLFASVSFSAFAITKEERLNKLVILMNVEKQVRENIDAITATFKSQARIKDDAAFARLMDKVLPAESLIGFIKSFYGKNMSDDELDDLIAFYQTKGGQRLLDVTPQMSSSLLVFTQKLVQENIALVQEYARNEQAKGK